MPITEPNGLMDAIHRTVKDLSTSRIDELYEDFSKTNMSDKFRFLNESQSREVFNLAVEQLNSRTYEGLDFAMILSLILHTAGHDPKKTWIDRFSPIETKVWGNEMDIFTQIVVHSACCNKGENILYYVTNSTMRVSACQFYRRGVLCLTNKRLLIMSPLYREENYVTFRPPTEKERGILIVGGGPSEIDYGSDPWAKIMGYLNYDQIESITAGSKESGDFNIVYCSDFVDPFSGRKLEGNHRIVQITCDPYLDKYPFIEERWNHLLKKLEEHSGIAVTRISLDALIEASKDLRIPRSPTDGLSDADIKSKGVRLGGVYLSKRMYPEAEEVFRKTVKLMSRDAEAWKGLGISLSHQSKYAEAEEAFRKATKLKPDDVDAWKYFIVELTLNKKNDEAEQALRKVVKLRPKDGKEWSNLAYGLERQGKYAEAEEALRKAVELNPDDAMSWRALGDVLQAQGKAAEAEKAYRRAEKR